MTSALNTVPAGFIVGVFGETDLLGYIEKDQFLCEKWKELNTLFEEAGYTVSDRVNMQTQNVFTEMIDHANRQFDLKLPRSPEDLK